MTSDFRHNRTPDAKSVGAVSIEVPVDESAVVDFGLSAALKIWTDELNRGDVSNWHQFAVEAHSLRNALRRAVTESEEIDDVSDITVEIDARTVDAVHAAARTCEMQGRRLRDIAPMLREFADHVADITREIRVRRSPDDSPVGETVPDLARDTETRSARVTLDAPADMPQRDRDRNRERDQGGPRIVPNRGERDEDRERRG